MVKITKYDVELVKESTKLYDLDNKKISKSMDVAGHINTITEIYKSAVEKFGMLCLDTQGCIIGIHIITIGTLNQSIIDMRSIFQRALLNNACSIIIFHNHPGGTPQPSLEDIKVTESIKNASEIMQIKLLDHVIIWGEEDNQYTSFAEKGIL